MTECPPTKSLTENPQHRLRPRAGCGIIDAVNDMIAQAITRGAMEIRIPDFKQDAASTTIYIEVNNGDGVWHLFSDYHTTTRGLVFSRLHVMGKLPDSSKRVSKVGPLISFHTPDKEVSVSLQFLLVLGGNNDRTFHILIHRTPVQR